MNRSLEIPILFENDGRDCGKQSAHKAIESPPSILEDQPCEDDQSTQRVVYEHDLCCTSQHPIKNLKQDALFWTKQ